MLKGGGTSGRKRIKYPFLKYIIQRFGISPESYPEIYRSMKVTRGAWAAWLSGRNRMSSESLESLRAALEADSEAFYGAYGEWIGQGKKNP